MEWIIFALACGLIYEHSRINELKERISELEGLESRISDLEGDEDDGVNADNWFLEDEEK